jgi:hypothetical protein
MSQTNFTDDQLKKLEAAISTGALTVRYADKTVQYRSLNEMLQVREIMRKALGYVTGQSGRIKLEHDKGL